MSRNAVLVYIDTTQEGYVADVQFSRFDEDTSSRERIVVPWEDIEDSASPQKILAAVLETVNRLVRQNEELKDVPTAFLYKCGEVDCGSWHVLEQQALTKMVARAKVMRLLFGNSDGQEQDS